MEKDLTKDIELYERLKGELEAKNIGKWVLIHDERVEGFFISFEEAAESAVQRFGKGPYLIRQIGAPPLTLSASVMFCLNHG